MKLLLASITALAISSCVGKSKRSESTKDTTDIVDPATVQSAVYDEEKKAIVVVVEYGGGCEHHNFDLRPDPSCMEVSPVRCSAVLTHNSNGDTCEASLTQSLEFKLEDYGYADDYYSGASIAISNGDSRATVVLPDPVQ